MITVVFKRQSQAGRRILLLLHIPEDGLGLYFSSPESSSPQNDISLLYVKLLPQNSGVRVQGAIAPDSDSLWDKHFAFNASEARLFLYSGLYFARLAALASGVFSSRSACPALRRAKMLGIGYHSLALSSNLRKRLPSPVHLSTTCWLSNVFWYFVPLL